MPAWSGVIVLKNGDRITGDIKAIWDGDVVIEPEYSDEFTVAQDQIAYIESDKRFELEYRGEDMNGRRAVFKGVDDEGNQLVELDGEEMTISLMDIGELDEEEQFFEWAVNADINAEINKGNTESKEIAITSNWYMKYGRQKHYLDTLFVKEDQDDPETGEEVTTEDRQLYTYNLNYELSDPWFAGAFASYETDDIKGLEYRYNLVPTIGYKIWDNAGKLLNFQAGYGYEAEEVVDENGMTQDESGGVSLVAVRFEYDFASPDLVIYHTGSGRKASYGRRNTVFQTTTGARFEITDLLYFNVEALYDYETEPAEGAEKDDLKLLIGFGLQFDS